MTEPLLRVTGIAKRYPGVQALDGRLVRAAARARSTACSARTAPASRRCSRSSSGAETPDAGRIEIGGARTHARHARTTPRRYGIATIYQELNLLPNLTVAENVFIGREPGGRAFLSWRRLAEQTREVTARGSACAIDPLALVRELSVAEQQMVEIARALSTEARVIIMDEPTSALSEAEVETLFAIVRELRDAGARHRLRHPPARRGDADLRSRDGAARRPPGRHPAGRRGSRSTI